MANRLHKGARIRARGVFAEWYGRTGDYVLAAARAGVSDRTGRRWRDRVPLGRTRPRDDRRRTNLAPGDALFVGRRAALETIGRLLRGGQRLVTVLGPPGIGKTRLAVRAGELRLPALARHGGVFLCDLTWARSADDICRVVARALGVALAADQEQGSAPTRLGWAIAARGRMLLVLDSFDHATAHAAETVGRFLELSARLQILVTSRVRLGLEQETTLPLPPLALPARGRTATAAVARSAAVELFVAQARRARPDYALTAEEAPVVAEIVRHLEGIPLAIELAAARLGWLGSRELLAQLERSGRRRRRDPERTLRRELARSFDLAGPVERSVLAQCAVFQGGFDREAAAAVLEVPRGGTLDGALDALERCSLLRRDSGRYGLYEVIRELAGERLVAGGGLAAARARHAAHYLESPARAARPAELENLLAVHRRALAARPFTAERAREALLALVLAQPVLLRQGPLTGYLDALDAAITAARGHGVDSLLVARAVAARGRVQRGRGRFREAGRDTRRALRLAAGRDGRFSTTLRRELGRLAENEGRFGSARRQLEVAATGFARLGDREAEADALNALGHVLERLGRFAEARGRGEEAVAALRALGGEQNEARAVYSEAGLEFRRGRLDHAAAGWAAAAEALERLGDPRFEGYALVNGGIALAEQGRWDRARPLFARSQRLFREAGYRRNERVLAGYQAALLHELGRIRPALDGYARALGGLAEIGDRYFLALIGARLGALEADLGRLDEARASFARAAAHAGRLHAPHLRTAIALHRGHLDLARAREALPRAPGRARAAFRRAAARLDAVRWPPTDYADEVGFARRMLLRELKKQELLVAPPPAPAPGAASGAAWRIADDGGTFETPVGLRVDLGRRGTLRRLLLLLARRRIGAPAEPVARDALIEQGWPGERLLPHAAENRLNVALVTLRKLGLGPILRRAGNGYLLDPGSPVLVT